MNALEQMRELLKAKQQGVAATPSVPVDSAAPQDMGQLMKDVEDDIDAMLNVERTNVERTQDTPDLTQGYIKKNNGMAIAGIASDLDVLIQRSQDKRIPLNERIQMRADIKRLRDEMDMLAQAPTRDFNPLIEVKIPKAPVVPIHILQDRPTTVEQFGNKDTFSLDVKLNKEQRMAEEFAMNGKSFVLTGEAGSGKTTTARSIAYALLDNQTLGSHTFNLGNGVFRTSHSIAFSAYTNRATDNIRRALHKDPYLEQELGVNVCTIHRLLEYTMEFRIHPDTGKQYPYFYPKRCAAWKLDITHLIIEESPMVDLDLWKKLYEALKPGTIVIFLGDINQLPPVFGPSVFNYAIVQLPVVELVEVHRQAKESPILSNAHRALVGEKLIPDNKYFKLFQTKVRKGAKAPSETGMCALAMNSIKKWMASGEFDVKTDIILSPINKPTHACGTKNINYHMAQYLGDQRKAKVHEILAGRNTWYLAEGDRVMVEKQDGVITKINVNATYIGKNSKSLFCDINRWGHPVLTNAQGEKIEDDDFELAGYEDLDVSDIPDEEKKMAASHYVYVLLDTGEEIMLETAGDFSEAKFSLGYAISVHKAQGSEWKRVVFLVHKNFKQLLFRELIYTAMTRAKEYLTIVDLTNCIDSSIGVQRIKGNSIQEKIEWFNSKLVMNEPINVTP